MRGPEKEKSKDPEIYVDQKSLKKRLFQFGSNLFLNDCQPFKIKPGQKIIVGAKDQPEEEEEKEEGNQQRKILIKCMKKIAMPHLALNRPGGKEWWKVEVCGNTVRSLWMGSIPPCRATASRRLLEKQALAILLRQNGPKKRGT